MPLTPPSAGQPVSATLIHEILRELRAQRVLQGVNTSINRTPNGTIVNCSAENPSKSVTPAFVYWKFVTRPKKENPNVLERVWINKVIQVGLALTNLDDDDDRYSDETNGADGDHYLEIAFDPDSSSTNPTSFTMKTFSEAPENDWENYLIYVYIGTVTDHVQTRGTHAVPVIYTYT